MLWQKDIDWLPDSLAASENTNLDQCRGEGGFRMVEKKLNPPICQTGMSPHSLSTSLMGLQPDEIISTSNNA